MGVNIAKSRMIAGYRPAIFKNALQGYARTHNPGNLVDLKSVFPLRRDGAIVFEECLDRRLIDPDNRKLTPHGDIIANAKAQVRTPFSKAEQILGQFLGRVDALNSDPEQIAQVELIWLFGSFMRRQDTVGDIDLAVQLGRKARYRKDYQASQKHARAMVRRIPDAPRDWSFPGNQERWLRERALFGPRRHPLLAGVNDDCNDLVSLAVPCQLIYDRERGGRIEDPILERHPAATNRDPRMPPPAEMPDLEPAPLRPMDGRWVAGYDPGGTVSPYGIFRGWTDDAHRLFPYRPEDLRIAADGHSIQHTPWTPKRLKKAGLDGRSALLLFDATERSGLSLVLERDISVLPYEWDLNARLSDIQLYRARTRLDYERTFDIAGAIALILAVDAERMCRRAREVGSNAVVKINIKRNGLPEDIQWGIVDRVTHKLKCREISIEPDGHDNEVIIMTS